MPAVDALLDQEDLTDCVLLFLDFRSVVAATSTSKKLHAWRARSGRLDALRNLSVLLKRAPYNYRLKPCTLTELYLNHKRLESKALSELLDNILNLHPSDEIKEMNLCNTYSGDDCMTVLSKHITGGSLKSVGFLDISCNKIGDEGMKAFSLALSSGALENLQTLVLDYNKIGDEGMKAFSLALSSGALGNLCDLELSSNQIGDEGMQAFSTAIASGALGRLFQLYLSHNNIGDTGMSSLAAACARGALGNLSDLVLFNNQIGDDGMQAFSTAIASGALGRLSQLNLAHNNIGDDGMAAFADSIGTSGVHIKKVVIAYNQITYVMEERLFHVAFERKIFIAIN